jgi:hypothetical protein
METLITYVSYEKYILFCFHKEHHIKVINIHDGKQQNAGINLPLVYIL